MGQPGQPAKPLPLVVPQLRAQRRGEPRRQRPGLADALLLLLPVLVHHQRPHPGGELLQHHGRHGADLDPVAAPRDEGVQLGQSLAQIVGEGQVLARSQRHEAALGLAHQAQQVAHLQGVLRIHLQLATGLEPGALLGDAEGQVREPDPAAQPEGSPLRPLHRRRVFGVLQLQQQFQGPLQVQLLPDVSAGL